MCRRASSASKSGLSRATRHADAFQQIGNEAFGLADEREREMFAVNLLMRIFAGEALRLLQRLLRFLGELFRLHGANLTQRRQDAKMGNNTD